MAGAVDQIGGGTRVVAPSPDNSLPQSVNHKVHRLALLLVTILPVGAWACTVDPVAERNALTQSTARQIIQRLWDNGACEQAILDGIASGKPQWLAFAVAIRPYTDAASSETLTSSLSFAMLAAPSRILPLVENSLFGAGLCIPSDFDDSPRGDRAFWKRMRRVRPMYEAFLSTRLREQAGICLAEVAKIEGHRQ